MNEETQYYIEMLEAQRDQALKGEAAAFARFKVVEAQTAALKQKLETALAGNNEGESDGRTD